MLSGMNSLPTDLVSWLTSEISVRLPPQIVSRPVIVRFAYPLTFIPRKQAGFFLPLSGGIDSCATAVIGTWGSSLRFNSTSFLDLANHLLFASMTSFASRSPSIYWLLRCSPFYDSSSSSSDRVRRKPSGPYRSAPYLWRRERKHLGT
jgi:hypothetical protein